MSSIRNRYWMFRLFFHLSYTTSLIFSPCGTYNQNSYFLFLRETVLHFVLKYCGSICCFYIIELVRLRNLCKDRNYVRGRCISYESSKVAIYFTAFIDPAVGSTYVLLLWPRYGSYTKSLPAMLMWSIYR